MSDFPTKGFPKTIESELKKPQTILRLLGFVCLFLVSCRNHIPSGEGPAPRASATVSTSLPPLQTGGAPPTVPIAEAFDYGISGSYLLVRKGTSRTYSNLLSHTLHLINDKKSLQRIDGVVSGSPERQEFKTRSDPGPAGSKRLVPEGVYDVAGGVPSAVPGVEGLFYGMGPNPLPRGDFGLHLDANRSSAPGTAGCIGFADNAAFSKFRAWMATGSPPRKIVVDWGSGSLQKSSFLSLLSWFERDEWTFDPSALARQEVDTDTGELLN